MASLLIVGDMHLSNVPRSLSIVDYVDAVAGSEELRSLYKTLGKHEQSARCNLDAASSHDPKLVEALLHYIQQEASSLDGVVFVGDLATTGSVEDLSCARDVVSSVAEILSAQGVCFDGGMISYRNKLVAVVPGNHDRYRGKFLLPGGEEFEIVCEEWWPHKARVVTNLLLKDSLPAVAVICADFTLRSPWKAKSFPGIWGQGRVLEEDLQDLRVAVRLLDQQFPSTPRVLCVHFPVANDGIDCHDSLKLVDGDELRDWAVSNNIALIVAGHLHRSSGSGPIVLAQDGGVLVCTATATQFYAPNGNGVHFVDIQSDDGGQAVITVRDVRWDEDEQEYCVYEA